MGILGWDMVDGGSVGNWIRIGLGGRDGGATHENEMSELTGIGNHPYHILTYWWARSDHNICYVSNFYLKMGGFQFLGIT